MILLACGRGPSGGDASPIEEVSSGAVLVDQLPVDTVAYLRVPSVLGVFGASSGRALDAGRASSAHIKAIEQIRQGFIKNAKSDEASAALKLLFSYWRGPLEVAFVAPNRIAGPNVRVLVRFPVGETSVAELQQWLKGTGAPIQLNDAGEVSGTNLSGRLEAGALMLAAGDGMNAQSMAQMLGAPKADEKLQLFEVQERLDQSKQGLLVWFDVKAFNGLLGAVAMSNSELAPVLTRLGQEVKSLSLAIGSVGGKGRLSLEIDAPNSKVLSYLPREAKSLNLQSAGELNFVGVMSFLPSPDEFKTLKANLAAEVDPKAPAEIDQGLAKLKELIGLDFNDVLQAIGPDFVVFADEAGSFLAVKIRDAAAWQRVLDQINSSKSTRLAQSGEIRLVEFSMPTPPNSVAGNWILERIKTRFYWREDDGYLVFAGTPQALRDRAAIGGKQKLGAWLQAAGGSGSDHSMLAFASPTRYVARDLWHHYLGLLGTIGDLSGEVVDVALLPSARELGLPADGQVAMQMSVHPDRLGFALSYDASPADLLSGGSAMTTVAVAGILAAIAIPAYQDFTLRAEVARALGAMGGAKTTVTEYLVSRNEIPANLEQAGFTDQPYDKGVLSFENGMLIMRFNAFAPRQLVGQSLALGVRWNDGNPTWICGHADPYVNPEELIGDNPSNHTTLDARYLPSSCRG